MLQPSSNPSRPTSVPALQEALDVQNPITQGRGHFFSQNHGHFKERARAKGDKGDGDT